MSSMVSEDVEKGRRAMNFSDWRNDKRAAATLLAACEAVESGRMPKSAYRAAQSRCGAPPPQEVRAALRLDAAHRPAVADQFEGGGRAAERAIDRGRTAGEGPSLS